MVPSCPSLVLLSPVSLCPFSEVTATKILLLQGSSPRLDSLFPEASQDTYKSIPFSAGLNENSTHKLIYLNVWFPVGLFRRD